MLYGLEPGLRDLVGEGRDDAELLRWYLGQIGYEHVNVYAIDDRASIDREAVGVAGGEIGARGRVLGLAVAADGWALSQPTLTCVIDSDWDCLTKCPDVGGLLRTDFGAIDGYGFQKRPLQKLLELVLQRHADAEQLIGELTPALNELFIVRRALHIFGPDIALVDNFVGCCEMRADGVTVDSGELARRSVAAGRAQDRLGEVLARVEELRSRLPEDRLRAVRGHDVAPLLIARLRLRNEWARPKIVERAWRGCLEVGDLEGHRLFVDLRARLAPGLNEQHNSE